MPLRQQASWLHRAAGAALIAAALAVTPPPCRAESLADADAIRRAIRDASRALQAGNAPLFLAWFDRRSFEGFDRFREQLFALAAQRRIASSVESGSPDEGPGGWTVSVDWQLDLTPKLDPGPVERRRETLSIGLRKRGGKWRIVSLRPRGLFASAPPPSR